MDPFGFEDLKVYQKARQLVRDVYALFSFFPEEEKFALSSQLRRAVVSITSNIAEGMGRFSIREQAHFIEIAYGSLMEVYSQLQVSLDLNYIPETAFYKLKNDIREIAMILSKLYSIRKENISKDKEQN